NNGTPYELRFYSAGTFRDFRSLVTLLKSDGSFGGDIQITSLTDYSKLNCTFKDTPDNLANKVLDYSDQVPTFKAKVMDVKLLYGRQVSFAPQNVVIPQP
ncbi:MAG: hypothetical protein HC842_05665, partial [Cytophagales bacterium]|nr:hypothetical protein [Cytophagales bacterium]